MRCVLDGSYLTFHVFSLVGAKKEFVAGLPKTLFEVKSGRHGTALSNDDGAYRKKMIVWQCAE